MPRHRHTAGRRPCFWVCSPTALTAIAVRPRPGGDPITFLEGPPNGTFADPTHAMFSALSTTRGARSMTSRDARVGPSGSRLPCSLWRNVCANAAIPLRRRELRAFADTVGVGWTNTVSDLGSPQFPRHSITRRRMIRWGTLPPTHGQGGGRDSGRFCSWRRSPQCGAVLGRLLGTKTRH